MNNDDSKLTEATPTPGADHGARPAELLALYEKMKQTGELKRHRQVSYQCPRRCMLLDVFKTADDVLAVYKPSFKLSNNANAIADPEAQAERTTDGDRKWIGSANLLLRFPLEYWLSCDHLLHRPLTPREIKADIAAGSTQPIKLNAVIK